MNPAEQSGKKKTLPRFRFKCGILLTRPAPRNMTEPCCEPDNLFRFVQVEGIRIGRIRINLVEVVQVPLTCQLQEIARWYCPGQHLIAVRKSRICKRVCTRGCHPETNSAKGEDSLDGFSGATLHLERSAGLHPSRPKALISWLVSEALQPTVRNLCISLTVTSAIIRSADLARPVGLALRIKIISLIL